MKDDVRLAASTDDANVPPAALIARMRGEFQEMPGLRLTPMQAARLCGVTPVLAHVVLQSLVGARFLRQRDDGSFVRAE